MKEYKALKQLLGFIIAGICLAACDAQEKQENRVTTDTVVSTTGTVKTNDTIATEPTDTVKEKKVEMRPADTKADPPVYTLYSNETFKNVDVKQTGDGRFHVSGKGRVFEGLFGWAVEDGQEELLSGNARLDAGPPEFGNFSFDFNVKKKRANSTLHLLIFENSAKDGSRIHQLRIKLN
jgi:hypothetical protein